MAEQRDAIGQSETGGDAARPEVFEDIPWERFTERSGIAGISPQQLVLVVIGVVLLGVLGWWFARSSASPAPTSPVGRADGGVAVTTPVETAGVGPSTAVPSSPAPTVTSAPGYDDLIAAPTDRSIMVAAEWYVRSYFTDPVLLGLPERARSQYVEWAATRSVTHSADGRVEVEVLVQTLVENDQGAYERHGVQSVTVPLSATSDDWEVADLPNEIRKVDLALVDHPEPTQPLPPEVGAAVAERVGEEVIGGGRVGDRWRVELAVRGLPVAVWVDDEGAPADPPRG